MPETQPPPMDDADLYDQLTIMNDTINGNHELSSNAAVTAALNKINNQPKSSFAQSGQVITSLNQVLPKFIDPQSSAQDYASGALQLTSSILYAASAIPGAVVITAPLGFLVGLAGAIVGLFGSKKPNMLDQIKVIVNDATDRQTSEQLQQDLAGAYREIHDKYITLSTIMSENSEIVPGGNYYNSYPQLDNFTDIASQHIGAAINNLRMNASLDRKDNWENTATTFFALSQVMTMKAMYISQGIAYYNIRQDTANGTEHSESSSLTKAAISIFTQYTNDAGKYFCKPGVAQAGITHAIFRLPEYQFRLIGILYARLGMSFWPFGASEYRDDHGRMTTLDMRKRSPEQVLNNSMGFTSKDIYGSGTYFFIWGDDDKNYRGYDPDSEPPRYEPPRYRWYMLPAENPHNLPTQAIYLFEVNPSPEERTKYNITDTENSLLMIGDTDKDNVWFSHSKEPRRDKRTYADCIKDAGQVQTAIWILLKQNQ